jgi:DNA-binding MarR family transcriptional regulator
MNELAARCGLSPSGLTRRFDGLVRRGWVERRRVPGDKRGVFAALTAEGAEVLEQCAPHHVASVRRHFIDHLTEAEVAVLSEVFGRLAGSDERASALSGA